MSKSRQSQFGRQPARQPSRPGHGHGHRTLFPLNVEPVSGEMQVPMFRIEPRPGIGHQPSTLSGLPRGSAFSEALSRTSTLPHTSSNSFNARQALRAVQEQVTSSSSGANSNLQRLLSGSVQSQVPSSPRSSPHPPLTPEMLDMSFLRVPAPREFVPGKTTAQDVVTMARALKEAANEFFNKQEYLAASERYQAAWAWIATIVKTKVLKVKEDVLRATKMEAVPILGNLSATMLKLNQPHLAIIAATECITTDDGTYFKGYFRRAEAMKTVGLRVVSAGGDPQQHFYYALQDYSECYKRMGNVPKEATMRALQYHNAVELAACYSSTDFLPPIHKWDEPTICTRLLKAIVSGCHHSFGASLSLHFIMIRMPGMPHSGLADRLPCNASGVSLEKIIENISLSAPVTAALVKSGIKVNQSDVLLATKLMGQEGVDVLHYLFQHVLKHATPLVSFADHLNLAVRLEKEVFVAAMLSGVYRTKSVCVTAETILLFYESMTTVNPSMIQTLSFYSPLWLRIKMLFTAFSCQRGELLPFIFQIAPCRGHNFSYITRPLTPMDRIFDISKVLKHCVALVGPYVLAVRMALYSQRLTPLLKCMFINYMLKAKKVHLKQIKSGTGESSPLRRATDLALKSGCITLLRAVCDELVLQPSDPMDGSELQKLVKYVESCRPSPHAAAVQKELLRLSDMKRRIRVLGSPSREAIRPSKTVRDKTKASTTSRANMKKRSRGKSAAATEESAREVKLSCRDAKAKVQEIRTKANHALRKSSYTEAFRLYNAALGVCDKAFPVDQVIENEKVSLYCKMSEMCLKIQPTRAQEALLYASNATELDPTYSKAYVCAAKALKALNRVEEAVDKYCQCYSLLKSQKDTHKLRAEMVHSAMTIALEHGELMKQKIIAEADAAEVGSSLAKLATEKKLSSVTRLNCLQELFRKDADYLASANFDVSSFSLSSMLTCADEKNFQEVFSSLLAHGVNITVADIEEAIRVLAEKKADFLGKMFKRCSNDFGEEHFTGFADLALKTGKLAFVSLAITHGARPDTEKLMETFSSTDIHCIGAPIQRYMLCTLSGTERSAFLTDIVKRGSTALDLSLTLKLVLENKKWYFTKTVVDVCEDSTVEPALEQEEDIDAIIQELTDDTSSTLAGEQEGEEAEFESKQGEFDGLAWEVECHQKVKQFLNSSKYPSKLRKAVIGKIYALASGIRSKSLSKPVANDLYEAKLTRSARIIWEEPIQFSPRLSNPADPANPVYTEVIRVWDIATNHERLHHTVENVLASRQRSEKTTIKLSLMESKVRAHNRRIKLPRQFHVGNPTSGGLKAEKHCVPAASPNENEYVLLPFYQVSSAYLDSVLNSDNDRRDLPFKSSPEEHQIITLPNAKEPILLLGRSGTGKTTCCVYRMWNQFRQYWEQAVSASVPDKTSHLHQVFITKNSVLCRQIKRSFYNMVASHRYLSQHLGYEAYKLPSSLQMVHNLAYPLFLTSKEFFVTLDASLGNPFFSRKADNSLSVRLISDGQPYDHKSLSAIQQFFNVAEGPSDADPLLEQRETVTEVTASYFSTKLWPHICQNKKLDPILVWMEIKSFIKGSHEALQCERGFLSQEQYEEVGRKKAPNFDGSRGEIYALFMKYQKILDRDRGFLFDECDFIRSLYVRLTSLDEPPKWRIDHFFLDEVQDFTEAELAVFIQCCREPNGLFFTGDTAQSIMRGVAFRFSDLNSLFYYVQKKRLPFECSVAIPRKMHKLTLNFRSHSKILELASSIIDLMSKYFPGSFDVLPSDMGMFPGPIPVLISSCRQEDLIELFSSNEREASPSLLGAHQVIIVRNEAAKASLPDILRNEIVLTVFESKGLEFDDVLLYNFFSNSMSKEGRNSWQVVTAYADEKWKNEGSARLPFAGRTHALKFDENQDKSLLSELKHLYTAITRAKCNFWVYDSDESKRLPIFDYWNRRNLVKVVDMTERAAFLDTTTSSDQWVSQGDYYKEHNLFEQAASCYKKAEATVTEIQAEAYSSVAKVPYLDLPQARISCLEQAAHRFLLCDLMEHDTDHLVNAYKCLQKAGHKQTAMLYSKLAKGGCFGDEM